MSEASESGDKASGVISSQSIANALAMLKEDPSIITSIASAFSSSVTSGSSEAETAGAEESRAGEPIARSTMPDLEKLPEMISVIAPMLSGKNHLSHLSGGGEDHRTALLCALKPYLSKGRQEMIDSIIKISKISEAIKRQK